MTAAGQSSPDPRYERVLVPVFFFGGGAHGAQWWTDLNVLSIDGDIELAVPLLQGNPTCPALCGCDAERTADEWAAESVCPTFEDDSGLMLYVPRGTSPDTLQIAARGRDMSRDADRYGTQIPVVWERDLLGDRMILLDIPTDPRYRTGLRLYDAYQWQGHYTLRFFDMARLRQGDDTPLLVRGVELDHDVDPRDAPNLFMRPAFAFIGDIVATWPELAAASSVAIEIIGSHPIVSPPAPDRRFYALASITNNNTQELTIVAPR